MQNNLNMINLYSKIPFNKTLLDIKIKVKISKCFYPGPLVIPNTTQIFMGLRMLVPRPSMCFSGTLFSTSASRTILCPQIRYPFITKLTDHLQNPLINCLSLENRLTRELALNNKKKDTKEYTTIITNSTTVNDITDSQLQEEMKKRELIKVSDDKTAVNIKLQDGSDYVLGSSEQKIKLSSLGQAYKEKFIIKNEIIIEKTSKIDIEAKTFQFMLIVPPENDPSLFIETGKQKHLLVVVDESGKYYSLGYLTSKKGKNLLSEKQVKDFQHKKDNYLSTTIGNKLQFFVAFKHYELLDKGDIPRVKWDKEYMDNLSEDSLIYLRSLCKRLNEEVCYIFDNKGLTKEDCLKMCQDYDNIAKSKIGKHPLSAEQENKNKNNKEKIIKRNENKEKAYVKQD